MRTRFRTLLLAGAAVLVASAAASQVTIDGSRSSIQAVMKIVWNGQDISSANPVPVSIASGGSGGGPVTVADGADVTQGAKADAAATNSTGSWTVVALLKGIYAGIVGQTLYGTDAIGGATIGASTAASGAAHGAGASPSSYAYFTAVMTPSQAGTLFADYSFDGTNFSAGPSLAMATPGQFYSLKVQVFAPFYRVRLVNGTTATASQSYASWAFSRS